VAGLSRIFRKRATFRCFRPKTRSRREWENPIKLDFVETDDWFKKLDDFSKLRVLLYYRYTRYVEEIEEYRARTGKFPDAEYTLKKHDEFTDALNTSKDAEAIWMRATVDRHLNHPL
jgi:hypothetical protein